MDFLTELTKKIKHPSTRVVFPEGKEKRIIAAAVRAAEQGIATRFLLGNEDATRSISVHEGIDLSRITIIDPASSPKLESYIDAYSRDHDFPTEAAPFILTKPLYFGAMMVHTGDADTMVTGVPTETEEVVMSGEKNPRKPGRPRAIPEEYEPVVVELYDQGYGYRAIARILREEYYLNPDYTSVRRTLRRLGKIKK